MTSKDGKNDPQDRQDAALFPMDGAERQKQYQRIATNLSRMNYLQNKIAADDKPLREEIAKLKALNKALLEELHLEG
jgi:hypothetical protein